MKELLTRVSGQILMLGMVVGIAAPSLMAQWPPFIHSATTNATETHLQIFGERFPVGSQVWLAQQQLLGVVVGNNGTTITALLPPGQLQPGTYVLRVIHPSLGRQGRSNVFEVTFGEVGPAGAAGTNGVDGVDGVGLPGAPGVNGANCYDGIPGGTSVLDCQGAQGPPGAAADVCAVFAALGQVPLMGTGLPCSPTVRFVDNGDGTVTDNQTGLMWEKKTACGAQNLSDPQCQENLYRWSTNLLDPNGPLFSDFLARLNLDIANTSGGSCFAGHCDWRIRNVSELKSILVAPFFCGPTPCIDAAFGPTQASFYWSSTTNASVPVNAWIVHFDSGIVSNGGKDFIVYARGVRGGR